MEAKSRLVVTGALVLATAAAILWFSLARGGDESEPASTAPPPLEVPAPVMAETPVAKPAGQATAPAAPAPERSAVPVVAAVNATLRGRCVDAGGQPLADCKVQLTGWTANSDRMAKWLTDHDEKPAWKDPPEVISAGDGTFTFAFWPPPPFQFALTITRDGCGAMSGRWHTLPEDSDTNVGDIAMTAGVRVRGRVVDADGVPREKEFVTLSRRGRGIGDFDRVVPGWGQQMVSRADGVFAARGWLAPGEFELRTQTFELQSPKTLTLSAERPEEEVTVVVAKPPAAATITGRVLDETGAPVPGVAIEDRSERGDSSATSTRDGTFELRKRRPDRERIALLRLASDNYDVEEKAPREVEWGATDVEFRVARAGELTLRVTDAQQQPVETYTVRMIPRNRSRVSSTDSRARAQGKHADGTVVVDGLTRGDWLVLVDFPAATALDPLFEQFSHGGGSRRMDLRATPAASRTLRVVTGADAPVAGTQVQLCDPFDKPLDDARFVMTRDNWLWNSGSQHALVLSEGTTDADGRVELRGPGGRNLGVCVLGPGHVPVRQADVRLEVADELVVRVSRGSRLAGKIVPAEAVVELKRLCAADEAGAFRKGYRPRLSFADDRGRRFPTDHLAADRLAGLQVADDGSFDVGGVPPGFWKVQVGAMVVNEGGRGGSGQTFAAGEVTLVDGQTTTLDLDLTHLLPGIVEGTVMVNGRPLANGQVILSNDAGGAGVKTDGEGRFRKSLCAGEYRLAVRELRADRGLTTLTCPTPVRVVRDQTTTVTFALLSTTLRVTVLDTGGRPVAKAELNAVGAAKGSTYALPPTDEAGKTELELNSETMSLRLLPKQLSTQEGRARLWQEAQARGDRDPFAPHWITLQTVTLEPGQTTTIEVRLPATSGY